MWGFSERKPLHWVFSRLWRISCFEVVRLWRFTMWSAQLCKYIAVREALNDKRRHLQRFFEKKEVSTSWKNSHRYREGLLDSTSPQHPCEKSPLLTGKLTINKNVVSFSSSAEQIRQCVQNKYSLLGVSYSFFIKPTPFKQWCARIAAFQKLLIHWSSIRTRDSATAWALSSRRSRSPHISWRFVTIHRS